MEDKKKDSQQIAWVKFNDVGETIITDSFHKDGLIPVMKRTGVGEYKLDWVEQSND